MNLYTVHDKAINSYQGVIALQSERDAIEQFRVVCNQQDTAFFKHPQDFTLVQVGSFDSETAELIPMTPKIIVNASALRTSPPSQQELVQQMKIKKQKTVKKTVKGKK